MIAATIADLKRYKGLGRHLDAAIDWLLAGGWQERAEDGKLEIDGSTIFALYQTYETKRPHEVRFETHRDYIDIQILISGEEIVQVRDRTGLEVAVPYVTDIEFQHVPQDPLAHDCLLTPGTALILFPEDAHRPCLRRGSDPVKCRKLVMKIHV